MKKVAAIFFTLLLLLSIVATPITTFAYSGNCENFAGCSGSASCTWWGVRCAVSDPLEFMEITGVWW